MIRYHQLKENLSWRLIDFWEKFFASKPSKLKRFVVAFSLAVVGFLIVTYLHIQTDRYFSSVTMIATILMTLYSGVYFGLLFTVILSILTDYFYIAPKGGIFETQESFQQFLLITAVWIVMNLFTYSLRFAYTRSLKAKQAAEKATYEMEQVLALVSHDIRNPLTASKMSAELILRYQNKPESHAKLASRIVDNLGRVDAMIQDLLDVSRIHSGRKMNLSLEYCDLVSAIENAFDEFTLIYGDRFTFKCLEKSLPGDWNLEGIRRALENLITNALKYGDPHAPIVIQLSKINDHVLIAVHNDGKEIPLEEQKQLFTPFHRSDSAESGNKKGWGLGLSLVKGIAEAHSGEVTVESNKDQGTTFVMNLPMHSNTSSNVFKRGLLA